MAERTYDTNQPQVTQQREATVPSTREETRYIIPPVDIYETNEALVVMADLPGVEKDQVDIKVENGLLTIQGRPNVSSEGTAIYSEFALYNHFRQFQLSEAVDQENISATLRNGVLMVKLPKAERVKPRQIEVKVD